MLKKLKGINLLNLLIVILLLALPYYLFEGKLFVGGDDTRLLYSYPSEFIKNAAYFSWYNFSSIGLNVPNQFSLPFLFTWSVLDKVIGNKIVLDYFAFSLPLILGFLYFQKLVKELFSLKEDTNIEIFIGSLCFILSPILIINQLFIFLTTIWLLCVVPIIGYYYIRFLKKPNFYYVYISIWVSFILASALLSVPWLLGFIIPILVGSFFIVFLSKRSEVLNVIKRTILFTIPIVVAHSFWLLGFLATYFSRDENSYAVKFISKDFLATFALTVQGTAVGNIIYPLLNLFHRNIAFGFGWKLKDDFLNLYDKTFFLNLIFVLLIFGGIFLYKKYLNKNKRVVYLLVLGAFISSLYFFTVNIGPLKELFLKLGVIPGFVMFRNFYDKFAPGYVFFYSIVLTVGLVLVSRRFPAKTNVLNLIVVFIILLNFSSVKSIVNSPLWTTDSVYKTMNFPKEYLGMMDSIKNGVSSTNTILSVPFGVASYTAIKDEKSDNVFVGVSPVRIFSGINDLSGDLSFNLTPESNRFGKLIVDRNYSELNKILFRHNVNYVLVTKNIPQQVLNSYIFNKESLIKQDDQFIKSITNKKILTSENGNYELFSTKQKNIILSSKNLSFKKKNAIYYKLLIKNLGKKEKIVFNDTYHGGWKLFIQKNENFDCKAIEIVGTSMECRTDFSFFEPDELRYLWTKPVLDEFHVLFEETSNVWTIDPKAIRNSFDNSYYKENKDGSIDVELNLYFKPQLYFYYGSIITFAVLFSGTLFLIYSLRRKKT